MTCFLIFKNSITEAKNNGCVFSGPWAQLSVIPYT